MQASCIRVGLGTEQLMFYLQSFLPNKNCMGFGNDKDEVLKLYICTSPYTVAQLDADAIMFGSACNGILRADACVYQQLFFGKVSADCLTDIGLT